MSKYGTTAADASSEKVAKADRGPNRSTLDKLGEIAAYIQNMAYRQRVSIDDVSCPSAEQWQGLAYGHQPTLPPITILRLYATDELWEVAATHVEEQVGATQDDALRLAYFEAATALLRSQLAKQAARK